MCACEKSIGINNAQIGLNPYEIKSHFYGGFIVICSHYLDMEVASVNRGAVVVKCADHHKVVG